MFIEHKEDYKIWDKLIFNSKRTSGPVGWVQVYLDNKKVHEGNNLIVSRGREFVAQKIFELNNGDDGTLRPTFYNYKVSHFAVGSGGATIDGNDVTLTGPLIGDYGLYNPIQLGDEIYLNEPSNIENTTESPIIHSFRNAVKPINTNGNIVLEPVSYENSQDFYTKVRCTCVVPAGEPSGLSPGGSVPISEAGLYFVNSALAETDPEMVKMFAHICFPPKWKELEATLTIFWYILC